MADLEKNPEKEIKKEHKKEIKKEKDLPKKIEKSVNNLFYLSEIDSEIFPFIGKECDLVNKENILFQIEKETDVDFEELSMEDFFEPITTIEDWFEEEEIKNSEGFIDLKSLLEENLKNLRVFKIGKIELEIYVVGLNEENILMGIQTNAVET